MWLTQLLLKSILLLATMFLPFKIKESSFFSYTYGVNCLLHQAYEKTEMNINNNDDRILMCCLQWQDKGILSMSKHFYAA